MRRSWRSTGSPFLTTVGLLAVWEAASRLGAVSPFLLPAPSAVVVELVRQAPLLLPHLGATLLSGLGGFLVGVFLGVGLALVLDAFPRLRASLYPLLVISQTIPIIFLYPLFLIWFGYGLTSKLMVVVLVCFFPVIVSLLDGLASVDPELLDLFTSMRAGWWYTFWLVRFPSALPSLFSGLTVSATYSIMGAVIGEWLGAPRGLGVYMLRAYKTFSTARVFAAILVVVVASLVVVYLVKLASCLAMPWRARRDTVTGPSRNAGDLTHMRSVP
ncbi:ABC-type transporter, integral membrane subunit [Spirochaeta thermophila DSM 6578]|uniref:ABC-type transporter, integral membrane subunit n=1 Tax=Winmispira thermophila (strain ATCC 700085 / DSM 6578 / Z-1203) TaxID=869211 RepID=G0GDU1_WINT7|nr:ABC transporter permease [Spirochaeta thermophila]AEJ62221.1 ABC-type transporter, integral membrane subunit [Spirochaeta thermophila DSM 6578]